MKKVAFRVMLISFALLVLALPVVAFANSASYSWTMAYPGYYVNGKANGVEHSLTSGILTDSGQVWEYAQRGGSVGPYTINIRVYKDSLFDTCVSSTYVTPYSTLNQKKSYSHNAGSISSGTYYVTITKGYTGVTDGWSTKGTGTLTVR